MFSKILLASDGSADAVRATAVAGDLAKRYGAELHVLHVFPLMSQSPGKMPEPHGLAGDVDPHVLAEWASASRDAVSHIVQQTLGDSVPYAFRQENGSPAETILRIAEAEKFDLIILGSRGLGAALRYFLGSVSDYVSHRAACSVLVVR